MKFALVVNPKKRPKRLRSLQCTDGVIERRPTIPPYSIFVETCGADIEG